MAHAGRRGYFWTLETDGRGLRSLKPLRLKKYGENKLPETKPDSLVLVFLRQFQSPLIYVLIAAAVAVLMLGEATDAGVILQSFY